MADEQKINEETAETTPVPEATTAPTVEAVAVTEEAPAEAAVEAPKPTREGAAIPGTPAWDPQPGQVVRVHLRITETTKKGQEKERLQAFEGTVIARNHGSEAGSTFTVRKEIKGGYAVERIFPIFAPTIAKVEVIKQFRVRRAKLHFLRARLKKGKKLQEVA
ncbi:MAG: 50S ribosomal protein L19 [bacterium]|nr:50S ribosomal protein L19 [bacterium]